MRRDKLEINQATVDILQRISNRGLYSCQRRSGISCSLPIAGQRWIAAGPPTNVQKAGMHWTPGDEVLLRVFGKV